ncbi:hypothetical protein [Natranaeroarchaeum aerophilus]|uniref:Phage tail assembly protein n=1 Tax=Natranaeroarchaeum aerophilus TaxID=2917711 RepID=A0AAE3K2K2_9EURY|nr:hypothetical protein [Natranaeroarchaeum aerophilus]MCL9812037.1 hypothetical protein [Natranaeroarchaeum aerophilus]
MTDQALQTEFEFTLPRGFVEDDGTMHKEGRMRLATAADEIQPLQDPKVQSNQSYLTITLLARVVTDLGTLETVDRSVIENLFVADLEYLQAMYERINNTGRNVVESGCPECGQLFDVDVASGAPLRPEDDDAVALDAGEDGAIGGEFNPAGDRSEPPESADDQEATGDVPAGNSAE